MNNRMRTNSEGALAVIGPANDLIRFREFVSEGEVVLSVKKIIPSYEGQFATWGLNNPEIVYEYENRICYKFGFSYSISSGQSYEPFLAKMTELFPMLIFIFRTEHIGNHIKKGTFLPNECGAVFVVKGSKNDLQKFKEVAMTGEQLLNAENFIPCPEQFENLVKEAHEDVQNRDILYGKLLLEGKSIGDAWRGACEKYPLRFQKNDVDARVWCTENWGTWPGFRNTYIVYETDNEIEYSFVTYSLPIKSVVQRMGTMFPSLSFDYDYGSPVLDFRGRLIIEKGVVKKDEYSQPTKKGAIK